MCKAIVILFMVSNHTYSAGKLYLFHKFEHKCNIYFRKTLFRFNFIFLTRQQIPSALAVKNAKASFAFVVNSRPIFELSSNIYCTRCKRTIVGAQFLFVAFGATVLAPLLVGLDLSVALFTAGVGTLIFHAITKGNVPIFLGSSFAFIAPIIKTTELYGLPGRLCGLVAVGAVRPYECTGASARCWLHY